MDRLQQLRGDTGGSRDPTLDLTSPQSESYITADESSKYFSISETDSSFDISSIKNVKLPPSSSIQDTTATETDDVVCNLSPIGKLPSPSESYKIGKQIEAANILSGGVNIFDDNDNSYDGNELVIDDNVIEADEKSNPEQKADSSEQHVMSNSTLIEAETAVESKDTEVVLQIDGKNVDAIDIGNGLYLYRKEGQEELAAVQIIDDGQQHPNFKFLKVRENAEGNLEVYEEIEIEVPKDMPRKNVNIPPKTVGHVPIKDINKVISDNSVNKSIEQTIQTPKKQEVQPAVSVKPQLDDNKETNEQKFNLNLKMKNSESRKSPLSFTPMTYHSTPNKDGVPLTKVMVDLQLQPSRHSDNIKKTIEVHTDSCKHKQVETPTKLESVHESIDNHVVADRGLTLLEGDKVLNVIEDVPTQFILQNKQIVDMIVSDKPMESKQSQELVTEDTEKVEIKENKADDSNLPAVQEAQSSTSSESKNIIVDTSSNNIIEAKKEVEIIEINRAEQSVSHSEESMDICKQIRKEEVKNNTADINPKLDSCPCPKIEASNNNNKTNNELQLSNAALKLDMDKIILKKEEQVKENADNSNVKFVDVSLAPVTETPVKNQESVEIKNSTANTGTSDEETLSSVPCKVETKPANVNTHIPPANIVNAVKKHDIVPKSDTENKVKEKPIIQNSHKPQEFSNTTYLKLEKPQSTVNHSKIPVIGTKTDIVEKPGKPICLPNKTSSNLIGSSDIKNILPKSKAPETKPINNNTPVPFGKWTDVNRQAFLNKIKESKVPVSVPNSSQQLKQANDLNRRDVLKKIDSQRQSAAVNAAAAKAHELSSKPNVKNENAFTNTKPNPPEKIQSVKVEAVPEVKNKIKTYSNPKKSQESTITSTDLSKNKIDQRITTINQDLIDRTVEDMLSKPLGLPNKKDIPILKNTDVKTDSEATKDKATDKGNENNVLDAVEKKMNELHGIPFVERPAHELPKLLSQGNANNSTTDTTQQKTNSVKPNTVVPNLQPFTKKQQLNEVIDIDEDEIIEHVPITGDMKLGHKIKDKLNVDTKKQIVSSQKDAIITEKDFDKFARRNSKTCEDQLTVNFGNKPQPKVQNIVQKAILKADTEPRHQINSVYMPKARHLDIGQGNHSNLTHFANDASVKSYGSTNSKLKHAYNMSMNALNQKVSPVTIIEDKPVKVVFIDSNHEFLPNQLNVQGAQLSPSKRFPEADNLNLSSCDSLDSDVMDAIDGSKPLDIKSKSKHQRKQVLTPVEVPDLELIEPRDLGVHESPKKKRKLETIIKTDIEKPIVPKKTYLLGRSEIDSNLEKKQNVLKEPVKQSSTVSNHKSAASAIDSLVKAAELLETQSSNVTADNSSTTESTTTPVKRGRGRPRKNPLPEVTTQEVKETSLQKKPRLAEPKTSKRETDDDDDSSDDAMIKENWTMGKINENIVCPICSKLFRSENVVFKHVKHCTGPSPSRSDSDKRSPRRLRRSYEYDLKNDDNSEVTDTESEKSLPKTAPKKHKSREHVKSIEKDEIIVIEDTPIKENPKKDVKKIAASQTATKSKLHYNTSNLVCEFCGKTFRQLSYLVSHKLQHKKETENKLKNEPEQPNKSVFSCEVCKKEFRKLHHLVTHRIIHNPTTIPTRTFRKSSLEQTENKPKIQTLPKQSEDQSAGFRCEPCDKSFRKLHHLVEHRETHREKDSTSAQPAVDQPEPLHQCDICMKTFKKLELLLEHKDQHLETSSEKSDDKSVKSSLSRDIIHECSLCYMVFPNEQSLNKHTINCLRKKRQSASKQAKLLAESAEEVIETEAKDVESISELETKEIVPEKESAIIEKAVVVNKPAPEPSKDKQTSKPVRKSKTPDITEPKAVTVESVPKMAPEKREEKKTTKPESTKIRHNTVPIMKTETKLATKINEMKRKPPVKDRMPNTVTKRIKSTNTLQPVQEHPKSADSSDDDDIRYMLNPDFKPDENIKGKQFMQIRANKRSSLQLERPNSKDLMKRRTSLQHPPKIPRLKPKPIIPSNILPLAAKPSKPAPVPSTDSDDSDVKYSFPETTQKPEKKTRKSLIQKRQSLNGIAKRKSMGQIAVSKTKAASPAPRPIKKRTLDVEHRCDCGELFSSAAMLSRHAVLAHTPPRIRRRRSPPPETTKSNPRTAANPKTRKSMKSRTPAHSNVPVPEKFRKLLEKSNKK